MVLDHARCGMLKHVRDKGRLSMVSCRHSEVGWTGNWRQRGLVSQSALFEVWDSFGSRNCSPLTGRAVKEHKRVDDIITPQGQVQSTAGKLRPAG